MTTYDESEFTPHAKPGQWRAYNAFSPEVEFCAWVGIMQRFIEPAVVLETGVGAGMITADLNLNDCSYMGFESLDEFRNPNDMPEQTPGADQMAAADLVILDSDPPWRLEEIALWAAVGKPGSMIIVHDAGNRHPPDPDLVHNQIRAACDATGIVGVYLRNPRGGWLAVHP